MFHLYRIYNLHPVKHDNLRPEKPQVASRAVGDSEEDVGEEAEASVADAEAGKRRPRRAKRVAAEVTAKTNGDVDEAPKKRARKKAQRAVDKNDVDGSQEVRDSAMRDVNDSTTQEQNFASLINQEDAPQPVDGATVEGVEAEEHPEAIMAAMKDGEGCGVIDTKKWKKGTRQKTMMV